MGLEIVRLALFLSSDDASLVNGLLIAAASSREGGVTDRHK